MAQQLNTDVAASVPDTDVPALASGVSLIGEYQASGYKEPPCLVRRADGQTIQLTPLLYALAEVIDGQRDTAQLADALSERIGRSVSDDNVRLLVGEKLRPAGLLKDAQGKDPKVRKANPLLALRCKLKLADEARTNRVTAPFAFLFRPWVVVPVVAAFVAVVAWTMFVRGLGAGTRQLLYSPALMLGAFALTILSASFHEFGHAAACRYSGGRPGAMGCGVYLVWPAFYTDVTDAYRLDRAGRLRTDLGGLYFNAIFALATFGAWAVTGADALLVMIPLQVLQMLHQLLPVVRMDGYHILSDLVGVPDLFARIKPTLLGFVPGKKAGAEAEVLKPWVRVVVALWVLTVVPLLIFGLLMVLISAPRVLATTWDSVGLQWKAVAEALGDGNWVPAAAGLLGAVAVALPVAGSAYSLSRFGRRTGTWAWSSAGTVRFGQPALALAAVTVAAGAAFTLWPNGEYRPIQPGERGTVADIAQGVTKLASGRPALTPEREAELGGAPARAWKVGEDAPAVAPEKDDPTTATTTATTVRPAGVSTTVARSPSTTIADGPATTTTVARTTTTSPPRTTTTVP
jgi:putative peptide zinc metalloprotease protein